MGDLRNETIDISSLDELNHSFEKRSGKIFLVQVIFHLQSDSVTGKIC